MRCLELSCWQEGSRRSCGVRLINALTFQNANIVKAFSDHCRCIYKYVGRLSRAENSFGHRSWQAAEYQLYSLLLPTHSPGYQTDLAAHVSSIMKTHCKISGGLCLPSPPSQRFYNSPHLDIASRCTSCPFWTIQHLRIILLPYRRTIRASKP